MVMKYVSLAECKIPSETLIKCSYCPTGMGDYLVVVSQKVIFLSKEWLAGKIEDVKGNYSGLVKAVLQEEASKNKANVLVWINGEGFEVPKKDVVFKD